jgi:serine/threonine protein kinase
MNTFTSLVAAESSVLAGLIDEYVARRRARESINAEAFILSHPEHAADLRRLLPAVEVLDDLGRSPSAGGAVRGVEVPGELGEYRLLREVGRGGMGVVYEAEQLSLRRRVALKVLSVAAALDSRSLQRFKNEAQAAAHLQHDHIVPVYAVGCERGIHYYAMQLIEGQSLAEVLEALRNHPAASAEHLAAGSVPSSTTSRSFFQAVARWGEQAASALEHAHQQGVIHRDVKPGNLLLDATGRIWVADFGLSRFRTEPGVTGSGDLIGTLRYMSPEQALARRGAIDHRSDIYALGVTLYEALTLEPAYLGTDREELLQQIAAGAPRPPRRTNPAVPRELETIVLKAMAREPEDRYATAGELADDLRRFQDGRPVLARRPALPARAAKWALRHKSLVLTAAAALVLVVAGLVATVVVLYHKQQQIEDALTLAHAEQSEAQRQARRNELNLQKALKGATNILTQLDPRPGGQPLEGAALHRAIEEQGLKFFQQFIDEASTIPDERCQSAQAYRLMGSVYCAQQKVDRALEMIDKAAAVLDGLVNERPEAGAYRRELVRTLELLGLMHRSMKQPREACQAFARMAAVCHLAAPNDDDAEALNIFAWCLVDCPEASLRDPELALALAEKAVAKQQGEARLWNTLGIARYRTGDFKGAIAALERSVELGGGSYHDWYFLAMAHQRLGSSDKAREWLDKASKWFALHSDFPGEDLMRYREEAAAIFGR